MSNLSENDGFDGPPPADVEADIFALMRAEIVALRHALLQREESAQILHSRLVEEQENHRREDQALRARQQADADLERSAMRAALKRRMRLAHQQPDRLDLQAQAVAQSPLFDGGWYQRTHMADAEGIDPAYHYVAFGAFAGFDPSESFNTFAYYQANLDVLHAGVAALAHYELSGRQEARALK